MAKHASRPNVIVFFTDQQRWDTLGCYGSPMDLTPNLDALAGRGVRFDIACTCQAVCAPARASLQTGKYATAVGVWRNGLALPQRERTLAHHFKDAGYRVGYIGKWHLANTGKAPVPPQFRGGYSDCWQAADVLEFTSHPQEGHWFDEQDRPVEFTGYRVDALTDRALQFIDGRDGQPFFLFISYLEPHFQNDMRRFVAPPGYAERYANPYVPPDLRAMPGDWMRELPDYYGMCARLDESLGRILQRLESAGLTDSTIVAFTSDHGCHFRTRNAEYKRSCHESSVRIPMVLAGPGLDRRLAVGEVVSLVDLPPTLLDASGLPVSPDMQGRSMMPLLDRRNRDWPAHAYIQLSESMVARAVRSRRWKYCAYAPGIDGTSQPHAQQYVDYQLYDLFADPHEQVNLVGRREYAGIAGQLRQVLAQRMIQAGEAPADISPSSVYA